MEPIIRGTTPSLIIDFNNVTDFTVADIEEIVFTIKYHGHKNVYNLIDINVDIIDNTLSFHWTEELTLSYPAKERIFLQMDIVVANERYRCLDECVEILDTDYPEVMISG